MKRAAQQPVTASDSAVASDAAPGPAAAGAPAPDPAAGGATAARLPASRLWLQLLAAIGCGLVVGLGYAPFTVWIAPVIGLAGFGLLVRRTRRPGWLGFCFGLAMFGLTISWEYVVAAWLPFLLVPFMSLWTAAAGWAIHRMRSLPAWPLWAAGLWTLMEFCFSRVPFGGFGWDRLGFTTADAPWGGYLGVLGCSFTGFTVALTSFCLAAALAGQRWLTPLIAAMLITLVGGGLRLLPGPASEQGSVNIGMVQGNVDGSAGRHSMGYARSVTNNHLSETVTLMARARAGIDPLPDFVVWPENSTDIDPTKDAATARIIDAAQAIAQRPILVGAVMEGPGPDERQTTGLWWSGGQVTDRYDKRNAVPFGEYTPLKDLVFALVPMAKMVGAQTVPGTQPGVLHGQLPDGRTIRVGDIICYELAFDPTIYDSARHGPQVWVVQSNNSSYTGTPQPQQQFQITRVRAMELQREIVVTTTSSFSGLILPDGTVVAKTAEATAAAQTFTVPLRDNLSWGIRLGAAAELLCAALGLAGLSWALFEAAARRIRVRRPPS